MDSAATEDTPKQDVSSDERPLTKAAEQKVARRERRLDRYNEVIDLQAQGTGIREIARRLEISRATVRRFLRADSFPEIASRRSSSTMSDSIRFHLLDRWDGGCRNAAQLWREVVTMGFRGSASTIRAFIGKLRTNKTESNSIPDRKADRIPSPRQVARLLSEEEEALKNEEQVYVDRLLQLSPELLNASKLAKRFIGMVKSRSADQFNGWLEEVGNSDIEDLKAFASGLYQDRDAVEAALQLEWSNGQVEGQINRLKVIKRQMYGRAKFDLLRKRVLSAVS